MIIAVNTGFPGESQQGDEFIFQCLVRLAKKNPQQQFICFFNTRFNRDLFSAKNIIVVITGPGTKNTVLKKYWYDYKLPALLKKYKADVLVSMNGICSLRTKLPQLLLVPGLSFLERPHLLKRSQVRFLKKYTPLFLSKAKKIICTSGFNKSALVDRYKIRADKIEVVYSGIDEIFNPVAQQEKETIKEKYAEGREYFLSHSSGNGINLLKAFSFFKKRQKSNMMLLLITGKADKPFKEELKNFKFRNEVRLIEDPSKEVRSKITAAAYAIVHPVFYDALAITPLQAMRCEVPVVCSNAAPLPELCGNAALYFSCDHFEDMAEKMMQVFKDEDRTKELVKAGKTRSQLYHWDKTTGLVWQSILNTFNN